jgi:hypothetical protein
MLDQFVCAALSGGATANVSGARIEHAPPIPGQRYAVKDYFPIYFEARKSRETRRLLPRGRRISPISASHSGAPCTTSWENPICSHATQTTMARELPSFMVSSSTRQTRQAKIRAIASSPNRFACQRNANTTGDQAKDATASPDGIFERGRYLPEQRCAVKVKNPSIQGTYLPVKKQA